MLDTCRIAASHQPTAILLSPESRSGFAPGQIGEYLPRPGGAQCIVSLILMPLFSLITWLLVEALGLSWTSKQHALVSAVPVVLLFGPIYRLITVPRDLTG
jgi:hypothetical protein